ncbi:rap1 GTPase-GDP dissociation stimulator 1 [Harmonia axyridis]|uniref:rap1 GTPase-GDP dissociation stimulator 1 n=1 Tax=Harmonia axyridis TaxID=115357 RepID=UPI001E279D18|nr:rap1 GTPase-GDP dissociation stimulator 1 [Harmonia axyridis]
MDEFSTNLNNLLQQNDTDNILILLKSSNKKDIPLKSSTLIKTLLKYKHKEVILLITELIADWAKDANSRKILSEKEIIQLLLNLLESGDDIVLNVVRALGNIFYENEDATKMLDKNDLDKILKMFYDLKPSDNILLLSKISGLLLNIFISNGKLKFVDKNQILNHITSILEKQSDIQNSDSTYNSYLLQIVYTLMVEYDNQIIYSEELHKIIIDILKNSDIPDLELICLQILYNSSEKDNVQLLLAKSNVCEKIFELIEKYKEFIEDDESRSILNMACDLINNILIEDEGMKLLYDQGHGEVYKNCIKWLDSDDEDLLVAAILAVGNFARNDANCISIVKEGISKKLIDLLQNYSRKYDNTNLLHSLLSTLKNLVVPKENKSIILEEGLFNAIKSVLQMKEDITIFKLLGTLRLVIDGQEMAARNIMSDQIFLEKLVNWFENRYHLGVRIEAARLLAWLIKGCHSWKSMQYIIRTDGAIACLVSIFPSVNAIMENEALVALNLLTISITQYHDVDGLEAADVEKNKIEFVKQVVKADIATILPYERIFRHSEQMLDNLISLLEKLLGFEDVLQHFIEKQTSKELNLHVHIIESQNSIDKIQKIISQLSV